MFVKAAPGLVIRDPATKTLIPAEGLDVSETDLFWARRLACGDAVRAAAPTPDPASEQPGPEPLAAPSPAEPLTATDRSADP